MNTEQAIEKLKELQDGCLLNIESWAVEPYIAAIKSAIAALREKAGRENPKPLTLEELMQRDGKPVFVVSGDKKDELNGWFIVSASIHKIESEHGIDDCYNISLFDAEDELTPEQAFYGMTYVPDEKYGAPFGLHLLGWLAFDHEPKEANQ